MASKAEQDNIQAPNIPFPSKFWLHVWFHAQFYQQRAFGWSIFQGYRDTVITVRVRGWNIDYDDPSLDETSYVIREIQREFVPEQTTLALLLEQGKRIQIPIVGIKNIGGKDGARYGMVFESPNRDFSTLKWWAHGPKEWSELVTWHRNLIEFLQEASENTSEDDI